MALPLNVALTAIDRLSNPLGRISSRLGRFGSNVKRIGKDLTVGMTLPIVAAGAAVISTGASFQSEMNNVRVLTNAVGQDFSDLQQQAKDLGSTTQFSARQAAEGQSLLAKAGFNAKQILAGLPATLNLAAAGNIEIGQSADIAATALTGYRFEVDQLARVSDVLTAGFTATNQDIVDISEALKKGGPVARALNLEFEETVAVLSLMAQGGARAEQGGTALRGGLVRLINPTNDVKEALRDLNLQRSDLFQTNGELRSLVEIMSALEGAGAGPKELAKIFGQKAFSAFAALLGQGSNKLAELTDTLRNSTGRAAQVASVRMEGATGAMLELRSATEGLLIAVGESGLLDAFTDLVKQLTGFTQRLGQADPRLLRVGTALLGVAAAVGPVLFGFGALITSTTGMISAVGLFGPALTGLATTLVTTVIPAIVSFTVALATNPVFLAITAIVALIAVVVLLATHWKETVALWDAGWALMKLKAFDVVDGIKAKMRELLDLTPEWLKDLLRFTDPIGLLSGRTLIDRAADFAESPTTIDGKGRVGTALETLEKLNKVRVVFENLPTGARVEADDLGNDVELETGFAMAGA